ncbi:carbamoyl-phosphate synthase, large subunit [Alkaliphilus metalliredigens QYMF]|uniref:Carbamoyl phosphate synthase large chain n=1 Tax=Alkaliphilus metalliredigens (strain QYMF) TaxID=293826 RepID=A6TTI8_ALKMQ|nr:carbamoyl-phosphate synthase large subunit [Alkaliphilus metalliredigens]ABR49506.1 carbamoyl-phosphate synthase, large subunit [Alkaliphilus metalliredigens QYMF]
MPKHKHIKKVLVIGSGPIIIGQAAEFDYAGTQACKSLREEGVEVVLVNSNPATIMTDENIADHVYIEPLNTRAIELIIKAERPQGILPTLGGQTGLNLAVALYEEGILQKYGVELLGTSVDTVKRAEDRQLFKETMEKLGHTVPKSAIVAKVEEAMAFGEEVGYPLIVRPAYTLGGTGGGIALNQEELRGIVVRGLRLSMINQVLIEQSVANWKEIEYEVMRDRNDNCITICNMENFDPVGIHTGDSIVVAPSQTLRDEEYQMLRSASIDIIRELKVEGGCNIQFALHPESLDYVVIEVNPRVSRSSALASKATGYAIAKVAAKIAIGLTLDEIKNPVTGKTTACFEPALDYVAVKIPRWPFDKFTTGDRKLGTQMKATGEVMAMERTFGAALLKAIRSLDGKVYQMFLDGIADLDESVFKERLSYPNDQRLFAIFEALRNGYSVEDVHKITAIDLWFLRRMKDIILLEIKLKQRGFNLETIKECKKAGFSDAHIGKVLGHPEKILRKYRDDHEIKPVYKLVDTCAGEFESTTPYFYSTYEQECEVNKEKKRKAIILGSGPIRIGQGIEFDYCCVHGAWSLKEQGIETIIINNNPETVSTDFDTSDKLYFEPLTPEDVINIAKMEDVEGVVVQYGGQTAINLTKPLHEAGIKILGTPPSGIDLAEDREKFSKLLVELNIPQSKGVMVSDIKEVEEAAKVLGFPLVVRPSYVIGGQSMEIVRDEEELLYYANHLTDFNKYNAILMDQYILGKEVEVDGISDGKEILIPAIMEHIERAGVHSGDSMSVYPVQSLSEKVVKDIVDYTQKIAMALGVVGLINIQYVVKDEQVMVIEANPRASRTVPIVSKVTRIPMVALATEVMMGKALKDLGYGTGVAAHPPYIVVKAPVFCLEKLGDVDTMLDPEMKSTGEVMGIGLNYQEALLKAFEGAGFHIPSKGRVLFSIADRDKTEAIALARELEEQGFEIIATSSTGKHLVKHGVHIKEVLGSNDEILEAFKSGSVAMVINTPTKGKKIERQGFQIRRQSIDYSISCFTSLDTAYQFLDVIKFAKTYTYQVIKLFEPQAIDKISPKLSNIV